MKPPRHRRFMRQEDQTFLRATMFARAILRACLCLATIAPATISGNAFRPDRVNSAFTSRRVNLWKPHVHRSSLCRCADRFGPAPHGNEKHEPFPTRIFVTKKQPEEALADALLSQEIQDVAIVIVPLLATVVSFFLFPFMVAFAKMMMGDAPNGTNLIVINAVFMPTLSFLLGSQISRVEGSLSNRQVAIHTSLNKETEALRSLILLGEFFPSEIEEKIASHLGEYVSHLSVECSPNIRPKVICPKDDALIAILTELRRLSHKAGDENEHSNISTDTLSQAFKQLDRISTERTTRITALQSTFPPLQYVIIAVMMALVCIIFLIEAIIGELYAAGNIDLSFVWSALVFLFSLVICVLYDLSNPFIGTFEIPEFISDDLFQTYKPEEERKRT